jgi:hypothetical protein
MQSGSTSVSDAMSMPFPMPRSFIVHCTSSLWLVQGPDVDKGRCSQLARSFGNHRNSPDNTITSFISFRSKGVVVRFRPQAECLDIAVQINIVVWCG